MRNFESGWGTGSLCKMCKVLHLASVNQHKQRRYEELHTKSQSRTSALNVLPTPKQLPKVSNLDVNQEIGPLTYMPQP